MMPSISMLAVRALPHKKSASQAEGRRRAFFCVITCKRKPPREGGREVVLHPDLSIQDARGNVAMIKMEVYSMLILLPASKAF